MTGPVTGEALHPENHCDPSNECYAECVAFATEANARRTSDARGSMSECVECASPAKYLEPRCVAHRAGSTEKRTETPTAEPTSTVTDDDVRNACCDVAMAALIWLESRKDGTSPLARTAIWQTHRDNEAALIRAIRCIPLKPPTEPVRPTARVGLEEAAQLIFQMTEFYQHKPEALRALDDVRGAILKRAGRDPNMQGSAHSLDEPVRESPTLERAKREAAEEELAIVRRERDELREEHGDMNVSCVRYEKALAWIAERTGEATDLMAVSIRQAARDALAAPCASAAEPDKHGPDMGRREDALMVAYGLVVNGGRGVVVDDVLLSPCPGKTATDDRLHGIVGALRLFYNAIATKYGHEDASTGEGWCPTSYGAAEAWALVTSALHELPEETPCNHPSSPTSSSSRSAHSALPSSQTGSGPADSSSAATPDEHGIGAEVWGYSDSQEAERWSGMCSSREEAIEEGTDEYNGEPFYIRSGTVPDPGKWATGICDWLVDRMIDSAHDDVGEVAEDYGASKEAEDALDELLAAWARKHMKPDFWTASGDAERIEPVMANPLPKEKK